MATVKTKKMRLGIDARSSTETVVKICYNGSTKQSYRYMTTDQLKEAEKRFYIKLPDIVASFLGEKEVRGNNQDEVFKLFEETIAKFKTAQTETHEIIAYSIDIGKHDKYFSVSGFKLEMWAGAFTETVVIAGDGKRRHTYQLIEDSPVNFPGIESHVHNYLETYEGTQYRNQVPRTAPNEKFFVWIKERMTELTSKLGELQKPEVMIDTILAGKLLPLGNPEKNQ
jgi:hypothetical protein